MLRTMRKDFKKYSWTLWLVIIVFIVGFSLTDLFTGKKRGEMDLISIGDTVIKGEEYESALLRQIENYSNQMKGNFNKQMITQFGVPESILQGLVNNAIIRAEAEKMDISATDKELAKKIKEMPGLQVDGKFVGAARYRLALQHAHLKQPEFEQSVRDSIINEKYQELVTASLVLDADTLKEKYKKEKDSAELDYILLNPERIKDTIDTTDAEIQTYYAAHKDDFKSQEKRSGNVIVLKYDDYKKEIKVEDAELFDQFKANKQKYVEPEKTKVSRILLKSNEANDNEILAKAETLQKELNKDNFSDKAKELSEDDKAQNGGDYGYWGWKNFSKPELTIIESLRESQISTPVKTPQGYAILFISEKQEKKQKEFDKVKSIIRNQIEKERLNALVKKKLDAIQEKIGKEDDIKAKATELGVKVVPTGPLAVGDSVRKIEDNGYISRQLFKMDKDKEISDPMIYPKGMFIVQITKIQKPEVEPLDNVKDKVKEEVIRQKKVEMVMKEAKEIQAALKKMTDQKDIDKFLKGKDLSASNTSYKRGNRLASAPIKKGLDDTIFNMEENVYSAPIDLKTSIAIVKVKKKTISSDEEFQNEKDTYYEQKLAQMKSSYFQSYLSNKRNDYEVRINRVLFDKIKDHVLSRFN